MSATLDNPAPAKRDLAAEEFQVLAAHLQDQYERRRRVRLGILAIYVDDSFCGTIDLGTKNSIALEVPSEAQIVEVRTTDRQGTLLLASHCLPNDEPSGHVAYSVVAQHRVLIFKTEQGTDQSGYRLHVAYEEDSVLRALPACCRRWKYAFATRYYRTAARCRSIARNNKRTRFVLRLALAVTVIALGGRDARWDDRQVFGRAAPKVPAITPLARINDDLPIAVEPSASGNTIRPRRQPPTRSYSGARFDDARCRWCIEAPAAIDFRTVLKKRGSLETP